LSGFCSNSRFVVVVVVVVAKRGGREEKARGTENAA